MDEKHALPAGAAGAAEPCPAVPAAPKEARGRAKRAGMETSATRIDKAAREEGDAVAVPGRPQRIITRWAEWREVRFLETLAATSNVAAAIRESGLSETSVYRRRRLSPDFRARWEAALSEGYVRLEAMMLDRAINGVERTVWHGGKPVGTMTEYSDRLGLALLAQHRDTVRGERAAVRSMVGETVEIARARLAAKLSEMNRRMGGAG